MVGSGGDHQIYRVVIGNKNALLRYPSPQEGVFCFEECRRLVGWALPTKKGHYPPIRMMHAPHGGQCPPYQLYPLAWIEAPRSPRSTAARQNLRGMRSLLRFNKLFEFQCKKCRINTSIIRKRYWFQANALVLF